MSRPNLRNGKLECFYEPGTIVKLRDDIYDVLPHVSFSVLSVYMPQEVVVTERFHRGHDKIVPAALFYQNGNFVGWLSARKEWFVVATGVIYEDVKVGVL